DQGMFAAILAAENRALKAANEKQKRKQERRRTYIGQEDALTIEEGIDRVRRANEEESRVVEVTEERPQKRAALVVKFDCEAVIDYVIVSHDYEYIKTITEVTLEDAGYRFAKKPNKYHGIPFRPSVITEHFGLPDSET
ncbi:hypothetical protein T310_0115, partial [Rasamsonia emersonii CBS 393.64]